MGYQYKTHGTCSTLIDVELDGNIVKNVIFTGGCNGNLQAIPKLVKGMTIDEVEERIGGISCNGEICRLRDMGLHAAIIGKAYYAGSLDLAEAVREAGPQS